MEGQVYDPPVIEKLPMPDSASPDILWYTMIPRSREPAAPERIVSDSEIELDPSITAASEPVAATVAPFTVMTPVE